MSMNVQGSNLYFIDPDSGGGITEAGCITTLDGLTAQRDQLEVTCMSDQARNFDAGLLTPGAATFAILFDASDNSHVRMHELYRLGTKIKWAMGLSDGTDPPSSVDSDGEFVLPSTRSFITFDGYISDFSWSFEVGQKVTNSVSIQVSDFPVLTVRT